MTHGSHHAESLLIDAYRFQTAAFTNALTLAESTLAVWKPGHDISTELGQIKAMMDQVAESDASINGVKQKWLQSGHKQTPAVAAALQTLTSVITRLGNKIKDLERLATGSRDQLLPQLDNLRRARQMQQAYGATGKKMRL